MAAWLRIALLAALVALSGCYMEVQVGMDLERDGSGAITVSVGLDEDAVGRLGGPDRLRELVAVDDLTKTGWDVTGPALEDDGFTWLRATRRFVTAEDATKVLAEVSAGPFRDFRVMRDRAFARTRYSFDGVVDFSGGLEAFGDDALTEALDGVPLGEDVAAIEEQFGATIDRLIGVRVAVRMPGAVESNAPGRAENGAVWRPSFADEGPTILHAESQQWRVGTLVWAGVGALAALALVLFLLVLVASRLRRGRAHRRLGAHAA
ncbi:MAG: hypothetical protein L0221_17600 [Chloroflexi bacterium]|nr:hypothetical protein [Chloroflexota bacterium]